MKNALIWIVGFFVILFIAGKTPRAAHEWLIIETGLFLFWICAGVLLLVRATFRFIAR